MNLSRPSLALTCLLVMTGCAASRVGDEDGVAGSESESSEGSGSSSTSTSESSTRSSESSDGGSTSDESTSDATSSESSESDGTDTASPGVEVTTIAYGDAPTQVLDLYLPSPAPADPLPTLVLAHGGLWQGGGRNELSTLCEQIVLGSGGTQACASIDYRLSQDLGGQCRGGGPDTYREQLVDFAAAFVLLQNTADMHGLDPARMFVGGHSAGGHLAQTLNLRWTEFEGTCTRGDCPPAVAALGIEGIYDIAAWDAYDQSFWNGLFGCATRKAFGDSPGSPQACIDSGFDRPCWEVGSPTFLAANSVELGISPVGHALMIHSPGDDWVDIAEASNLGTALESAFPMITVLVSIDGTCAVGAHGGLLGEPALAACLVDFVASGGTAI